MIGSVLRWSMPWALALAIVVGCKRPSSDDDGATSGAATAAPAATPPPPTQMTAHPVPGAETAAANGSADAPPPEESAAPGKAPKEPREPKGPVARPGPSLDGCCAALQAYQHSGRPPAMRQKAVRAAQVCRGIAETVRSGR